MVIGATELSMSTFRGRTSARQNLQRDLISRYAGHTGLWHRFVSATNVNEDAGLGATNHFQVQVISAYFGDNVSPIVRERQQQVGMVAGDAIYMVTRTQVGREDRFTWLGETWRIEGEPMPSRINDTWIVMLKRGKLD